MKSFIYLIISLISINLFAQKKVMTHEDMWLMKRVGSPALSPDGKHVVFSVLEQSYNDKEIVNDIWIAPTDGSEAPRKLTTNKAGESSYSFSPDGKYLAFVAKRDGEEESQIYLLNMKGGEAQKFTSLSSGAGAPIWSPDSKKILFTSSVYPNCFTDSLQQAKAKEKKDQKYKVRVYESFPIRNWDKWLDEKQTHLYVQHIDSTKAQNLFTKVNIVNEAGFAYESANWANNEEVVFSASTEANQAAYKNPEYRLYVLNIRNNNFKLLSDKNFSYTSPKLTSDGKFLYTYREPQEYKVYQISKLAKYTYPDFKLVSVLNEKLDRPINNYDIAGQDIIASVQDKGREKLYRLSDNGFKEISNKINKGSCTNVTVRNNIIFFNYEKLNMPPEIAKINSKGDLEILTSFNKKKLESLDLDEGETFWTKTSRGKEIRSMVIKPANFNSSKKYPLVVLMHGGPAISYTESFGYRWNPHVIAGEEFVIVMTDYTGSTGYGEKFSQDIQGDPFRGPAQEINEAAADAIKRYSFINGEIQAAGGASYGGHLANWMQATTSHYKCLIAHAGLVNSISQWGTSDYIWGREIMNGGTPWGESKTWHDQNPMKYAANFKTPMLLTIGELDYRVPLNNTIESWHIHQRLKIPSKLLVFPDENHWILKGENSRYFYKEVRNWLINYLK